MKNIIFIGGIHGSGKGRICELVKAKTDIVHLTASEVLKWSELSPQEEKLVNNIDETQNRLVNNLKEIIKDGTTYLLDGHFCLLNKNGIPEKVPINTFRRINLKKLILVVTTPEIIKIRLENRDAKNYDFGLIEEFQNLEIAFANEISQTNDIPLLTINSQKFEIEDLLDFLR